MNIWPKGKKMKKETKRKKETKVNQ